MNAATHAPRATASTYTHRAWWSLLGFVPSFPLSFLVGEGLISLLGHDVGGGTTPPLWAILLATIPALVVFALPAFFAVHFGRRAVREGDTSARAPMVIGVVLAGGFVLLNVASGVATLLLD